MPFDISFADPVTQRLLTSVVLVLVAIVVTRLIRRATLLMPDPAKRYKSSKLTGRIVAITTIVWLALIWSPGAGGIVTILTIVGAGLAIAMREVLLSLVAWVVITFRHLYDPGDRIEVNGVRGDVVDVRLLHSTLMEVGGWVDADQSSGRIVHVPNNWIFQHAAFSYTHGFPYIWNEIVITVTFRSNWQEVRKLMLRLAGDASEVDSQGLKRDLSTLSREYLVHYNVLTPFVYTRVVENGVRLTLRYLCEARKRRGTEHELTTALLEEVARMPDVEFAYPSRHVAMIEGTLPQGER
jgi:small-conductance mechanosensitive channel